MFHTQNILPQKEKGTMTENERILSIKRNGGRHLQNFKPENITYSMCMAAVSNDGTALYFVPERFRDAEIYKEACKNDGLMLALVPEKYISQTICEYAVKSNGLAIKNVPERFRTREIYLYAACNEPLVMQKMPPDLLTPEFCIEVIEQYGYSGICSIPKWCKNSKFYLPIVKEIPQIIRLLPKSAHTATVSKAAIKSMGYQSTADAIKDDPTLFNQLHTSLYDHDTCLAYVSSELFAETFENAFLEYVLLWPDVCSIAVKSNPRSIRFIAKDLLTPELCWAAVNADGGTFHYIPEDFKTEELCLLAFEREPFNLDKIPERYLTHDLCLRAAKHSGYLLDDMPKRFRTKDVCLSALKSVGSYLQYVPEEILDEEICLTAFKSERGPGYGMLQIVPDALKTYSVCLEAIQAGSENIKYVPENHKTYELCLLAVKRGSGTLSYIPKTHFTEELCMVAASRGTLDFASIPKDRLTEKICLEALNHSPRYHTVLSEIPDQLITQEMCDISVKKAQFSFKFVPERFVTEEMLMYIAELTPGLLDDNFPDKFRTEAIAQKIISSFPDSESYVRALIPAAVLPDDNTKPSK